LLGISITASMPFCVRPTKESFNAIFNIDDSNNYKLHFITTFSICFTALLVSILLKNMSIVLNFIGLVSSPLICFIFPAMFYLNSIKDKASCSYNINQAHQNCGT